MPTPARVENIDALKAFRLCLMKFGEAATVAIGDAESEMQRTLTWLETEQRQYWQGQIRKRHDLVEKCKEAVRMKKLFKDSSGRTPSAIDEEKALAKAKRLYEEAEQKLAAVKRYVGRLGKEIDLYKGSMQRLASSVQVDIPVAAAKLDAMVTALEQYVALAPTEGVEAAPVTLAPDFLEASGSSMVQAVGDRPKFTAGQIRQLLPSPEARTAAIAGDLAMSQWRAGTLIAEAREAVAELGQAATLPDAQEKLTLVPDCWSAPCIFLARLKPAFPGDSGWHIAATTPRDETPLLSASVGDLLDIRGDFGELLHLPEGFIAILDTIGLVAVFDPEDQQRIGA